MKTGKKKVSTFEAQKRISQLTFGILRTLLGLCLSFVQAWKWVDCGHQEDDG